MKNDFYAIACEDIRYLQATLHLPYYNQIAVQSQQVAEKMIKSVAERSCVGIEKLMHSHNLRALYDAIHEVEAEYCLNRGMLSMLKDFYFDAKYPGDNFVTVSKQDCQECLDTMYEVVEQTNSFRIRYGLDYVQFDRIGLSACTQVNC